MKRSNFTQLEDVGWTVVHDIYDQHDLITVASELGVPVKTRSGIAPFIVPKSKEKALSGTFGSVYGTGVYPLHTDTAHWLTPAQYIVLSAKGDIRRPTTLMSVKSLLNGVDSTITKYMRKSIWYSGNRSNRFYCKMTFTVNGVDGLRFDPICMKPANESARKILKPVLECLEETAVYNHVWDESSALVIDNWHTLHGRGTAPLGEGVRQLFRVLVR